MRRMKFSTRECGSGPSCTGSRPPLSAAPTLPPHLHEAHEILDQGAWQGTKLHGLPTTAAALCMAPRIVPIWGLGRALQQRLQVSGQSGRTCLGEGGRKRREGL